jgi:hypothetical protein
MDSVIVDLNLELNEAYLSKDSVRNTDVILRDNVTYHSDCWSSFQPYNELSSASLDFLIDLSINGKNGIF